ncbi:hypothetical protein B0A55_11151 [Friedmanniomyces simplex]|uniref:Heterokaryon incompatibility domain-containing protein n=1 Tax=Friedmanniomyces simplex TaxID=329884 RepID=A0A4U0WD05_9PEZI|nr:hypothetical protein B0A55_11151 [Friedmanniomyces simplex]
MRLLNCKTLEFEEFHGENTPGYTILSHRWGEDEVSYKEFRKGLRRSCAGYKKILEFCRFVREADWGPRNYLRRTDYAWIDTCCIDKRSSSELSESINSIDGASSWSAPTGMLALSPRDFLHCADILPFISDDSPAYSITNRGVELECSADKLYVHRRDPSADALFVIRLNCGYVTGDDGGRPTAPQQVKIALTQFSFRKTRLVRASPEKSPEQLERFLRNLKCKPIKRMHFVVLASIDL